MTLWPGPLTSWPWSHVSRHVMPLGWSIPVPSLRCIRLTVPELWRLQFSIDRQLKVPFFHVFWRLRGSNFKFHLSNPQKALPWRERRKMTYCAWGYVQRCDLWAWWRKEKRTFVKLVICPDHPRQRSPLKFCVRGRIREVVIYFRFHDNRSRGLGAVGSKIALSHWLGPWLIQQLVLPYKPWRCSSIILYYCRVFYACIYNTVCILLFIHFYALAFCFFIFSVMCVVCFTLPEMIRLHQYVAVAAFCDDDDNVHCCCNRDLFHNVSSMTVDKLAAFENVRVIRDYVSINAYASNLTSLNFFKNLRTIKGQSLTQK